MRATYEVERLDMILFSRCLRGRSPHLPTCPPTCRHITWSRDYVTWVYVYRPLVFCDAIWTVIYSDYCRGVLKFSIRAGAVRERERPIWCKLSISCYSLMCYYLLQSFSESCAALLVLLRSMLWCVQQLWWMRVAIDSHHSVCVRCHGYQGIITIIIVIYWYSDRTIHWEGTP